MTPRWSQEVTECDRQALHGVDPFHVPPVTSRTMDCEKAQAACEGAVRNDPDNPRFNYQLGRVYGYSGQWPKEMLYRFKAELAGILDTAEAQTSDFYAGMWIEDLKTELAQYQAN